MAEISDDDFFCVEADHNPHKGDSAVIELYFPTKEQALAAAEEKLKKFKAVWISEYGIGSKGESWFYFWWSPAVQNDGEWGELPESGFGYDESRMSYPVSYKPFKGNL